MLMAELNGSALFYYAYVLTMPPIYGIIKQYILKP
jgi:hypothetical protein